MSKMLEVSGLCMRFGGLLAVNQVAVPGTITVYDMTYGTTIVPSWGMT